MTTTKQYETYSDEQLFTLVQEDNQEAFSALYSRYDRRLYSYCYRMVANTQMAEDIFHDVMLKMYENRQSFKAGSFAKWIFTIARTRCLNALRDRKYTEDVTTLETFYPLSEKENPGDNLYVQELLQKTIATLPEELREALVLRHFDEYSYAQIAEMTGIGISLAKVRVFRAIKMIQKRLSPYLREA